MAIVSSSFTLFPAIYSNAAARVLFVQKPDPVSEKILHHIDLALTLQPYSCLLSLFLHVPQTQCIFYSLGHMFYIYMVIAYELC